MIFEDEENSIAYNDVLLIIQNMEERYVQLLGGNGGAALRRAL